METLAEILNEDFLLSLFGVLVAVIYSLTAGFAFKKMQQRKVERKNEFFETLVQGMQEGTILNTEDLINVYKGVTNLSSEDLSYRYGLNRWLRELLAKLVGRKFSRDFDSTTVKEIKHKITEFIKTNEQISPYSDLPDTERNILSDISSYTDNGDKDSLKRKIKELSSVIQTRYEEQKKLESQNKWSVPLAVVGLVLTIIFGILSIF